MKITEKEITLLDTEFPEMDLRYRKDREKLTGAFPVHIVRILKRAHCINKIFYGNGGNAYRYYAPIGFTSFVENIEEHRIRAEYAKLMAAVGASSAPITTTARI